MDFDEYDYLEKAVDAGRSREKADHRTSRDANVERRRSRDDDRSGDRRDRREKDHRRSSRDGERERDRDRDEHRDKDRGMDKESERGRERPRRREGGEDVERERERSSSRSRRHERDVDVERERPRRHNRDDEEEEMERERSRRSRSGSRRREREVDVERERARSSDRVLRERETEGETGEREGRRSKDKKEAAEPEADPERDQRTVFAYQMPLKATERDVYEFFSRVGKVRDVRLIMDRNSRRSKGVGYIEFYDVASVQAAILLSGQLFLGQPVMVKHSEAEKNLIPSSASGGAGLPGSDRKLYVGNLHFNMTEGNLRQIFEAFGPVDLVQMPLDMETGHCKGFGFVQFAQLEHAKAAQHSLNGILEIAGRIIKVSSVIEHMGNQDTTTTATDFDDEDGGALSLNARSRALLMQKLDRTGTASSIAESLGVPVLNGNTPTPLIPTLTIKGVSTLRTSTVVEPIGDPSEYVLLKNMFDPKTETNPDFDLEIKDDVQDECSKFGSLKHIYVDKNSNGFVYLRFNSVPSAVSCQRAMHMRWFARRCISALFMRPHEYEANVKSAP